MWGDPEEDAAMLAAARAVADGLPAALAAAWEKAAIPAARGGGGGGGGGVDGFAALVAALDEYVGRLEAWKAAGAAAAAAAAAAAGRQKEVDTQGGGGDGPDPLTASGGSGGGAGVGLEEDAGELSPLSAGFEPTPATAHPTPPRFPTPAVSASRQAPESARVPAPGPGRTRAAGRW
jgi:hypothetical protein